MFISRKDHEMLTNRILDLTKENERLSKLKNEYHERVIDIENAFEKEQSIKIRQEITEIKSDFSKLEMAIIFAGIVGLLKNPKTPEDARFYLSLHDKIQKLLDNMKEEESENNAG